jgi:hypothetical protein
MLLIYVIFIALGFNQAKQMIQTVENSTYDWDLAVESRASYGFAYSNATNWWNIC